MSSSVEYLPQWRVVEESTVRESVMGNIYQLLLSLSAQYVERYLMACYENGGTGPQTEIPQAVGVRTR